MLLLRVKCFLKAHIRIVRLKSGITVQNLFLLLLIAYFQLIQLRIMLADQFLPIPGHPGKYLLHLFEILKLRRKEHSRHISRHRMLPGSGIRHGTSRLTLCFLRMPLQITHSLMKIPDMTDSLPASLQIPAQSRKDTVDMRLSDLQ